VGLGKLGVGLCWCDAGTALTLTGADADRCLVGAILPRLQLQSLAQRTGGLPLVEIGDLASLPPRWALNEAIQSGVIYTIIAGIRDFIQVWQEFPRSCYSDWGRWQLTADVFQSQFPR